MQKIGRNELCPCGSGKKYKKCCLAKEQGQASRLREESTVAKSALDWLGSQFPDGVRTAIQTGFYTGLKKAEKQALDDLAAEKKELLSINIGEWLLTDAKIAVQEENLPVRELLLSKDVSVFSDAGRSWLSSLGERTLSLFEVRQLKPGVGLLVKDLLSIEAPEVWVAESKLSRGLVLWDIFGARLVQNGEQYKLSGAVYPFLRETANACKAKILRKVKGLDLCSAEVREICCSLITTEWLRSLVTVPSEETTEDAVSDQQVALSSDSLDTWIEEPLVILGNRSPRNALRTAAGRRSVIELLKTYENQNAHHVKVFGGEAFEFDPLWNKLGLKRDED
ncbi:MAG: SEC-C metal-binding domain-containing protein [Geobacteraceae bacterium]